MSDSKRSVDANAVIVVIVGAVLAIWLAVNNDSLVGGFGFFVFALLCATTVHVLRARRK